MTRVVTEKEALIVEQIPKLRRYARALTGNRAAADDLVQDCLERAWGRFHLWQPGSNMRAWMFTIMHNCFANTMRKNKHQRGLVPIEEWSAEAQIAPNQENSAELRGVAEMMRQLPTEQREVLLLIGLEEMTYAEVSEALEIPLGTVMSRLSRGRERLRALIAQPKAAGVRAVEE
ncbi:MAG: RNA polymerase sigma factor [Alphaproteobacteria bacterium]|nr:RNA polymerase sigma factor [Alphaproteobacteria bacterium]